MNFCFLSPHPASRTPATPRLPRFRPSVGTFCGPVKADHASSPVVKTSACRVSASLVRNLLRCRVGGDALARGSPSPLKLYVQFSRVQLSRRLSLPGCNRRDQLNQVHRPVLAVQFCFRQPSPATVTPLPESMRPNSPHNPAVEPVDVWRQLERLFSDNYLTVFTPEGRAGVRRRRGGEAPTAWDGKNALNPGVWGEAPSQAKRLIPVGLVRTPSTSAIEVIVVDREF